MRPANVKPFTLGGWPLDEVDPSMMRKLKTKADRKGLTVEEAINEALLLFLARHEAARAAKAKIIRFPKARQPR